jgi:hypothetical protein
MEDILRLDKSARHRGLRARRFVRTRRSIVVVLSSALVLTVGIAAAADNLPRDARSSHTITVIDRGLLSPEALTMGQGEALEFANYSSEPIGLVFIEPKDPGGEIRCRLSGNPDGSVGSDAMIAWPIIASGPNHHLTVTIPPGRHATTCSLKPGRYAFVTKRVGRDPRSPLDALGQKGTITVE